MWRETTMKYMPILQESFESDSFIFLFIGIFIAVITGLRWKKPTKAAIAVAISVVVYAFCEFMSNLHTNYMVELLLLFVGTVSIGCCIEYMILILIRTLKKSS